jgi:hypothetical protein
MRALRFLALGFAVCIALTSSGVRADELVLPYACTIDNATPRLTPSEMTTYQIIGPRQNRPFIACSTCETMMVHKFMIECGGQRVLWSRVAASGRLLGIALPDGLPAGFAPISRFQGRLLLPGFGKTTTLPQVTSETLSRDAILEPPQPRQETQSGPWVTVVDPVVVHENSGDALKVAGVVSTLLAALLVACLFLVRRRQFGVFEFASELSGSAPAPGRVWDFVTSSFSLFLRRFEPQRRAWTEADGEASVALAPIRMRLHETELIVLALPGDLLLRDVLTSELDGLYDRIAALERRDGQLGSERLRLAVRSILRDLDRIGRIANGAMPAAEDVHASEPVYDAPSTVFEAYRILGLNPDAPDAAVKKIVDALRMSWHPDHARGEADRRYREQRIKQVNAAWDLLKTKLAAAA